MYNDVNTVIQVKIKSNKKKKQQQGKPRCFNELKAVVSRTSH